MATVDFTGGSGSAPSYTFEGGLLTVSPIFGYGKVTRQAQGIGANPADTLIFPDNTNQLDDLETLVFSFTEKVKLISFSFAAFEPEPYNRFRGDDYIVTILSAGPTLPFDFSEANPFLFGGVESSLFKVTAGLKDAFYISSLTYEKILTPRTMAPTPPPFRCPLPVCC